MSATATAPKTGPTEGCRYCWMCRQACPVGQVTARETYTPHAWALMIESVARGQITWNRESADVMYACADCGLCQAHCVTDQPLPLAINQARTAIARAGSAPAVVYALEKTLRAHGNAYGASSPVAAPSTGRVALFVGDVATRLRPEAIDSAKVLLAAIGITPVIVGLGRSSGLLANTLGLEDAAVDLAKAVVADVNASGAAEVLVLGPADKWTFTTVFAERLGVTWPADVAVREVSDVLAEALAAGRLRFTPVDAGPYAYHDPCQTPRLGRTRPGPRALLAAAYGAANARDLFWREHRAHPCGATGGLDLTHPGVAAQMADARLADASSAGAVWIATDEPQCAHQLAGRDSVVKVRGLFEALADRL